MTMEIPHVNEFVTQLILQLEELNMDSHLILYCQFISILCLFQVLLLSHMRIQPQLFSPMFLINFSIRLSHRLSKAMTEYKCCMPKVF